MSLINEMDVDVVAFRPERAGESVEGVVVSIDSTTSEYGSYLVPVITLKDADGIYRGIRGYQTVLRNELEKLDLQVGDTLAVLYEGKKPTKDNKRTFHSFKVRSVKGAAAAGNSDTSDVAPF